MYATGRQPEAVPLVRRFARDDDTGMAPDIWQSRWTDIVDHLQPFLTEHSVEQLVDDLMARQGPVTMAFINAHVMNLIVSQPLLSEWLRDADLILRDGIGVSILLRILGVEPGLNLNGTDLIPRLVGRFNDHPIALFGTAEPYLEKAAEAMVSRHGRTRADITTSSGFQDDAHYVDLCLSQRPRLVVLGMGVPKQERIAALLKRELTHDCLIVCGGAILDFYARRFRRAPESMQRLHMEWMFRLALEPVRLFGRYVVGNPIFLFRAARLRMSSGTLSLQERHHWNDNAPALPRGDLLIDELAGRLSQASLAPPLATEIPGAAVSAPVPSPARQRETSS